MRNFLFVNMLVHGLNRRQTSVNGEITTPTSHGRRPMARRGVAETLEVCARNFVICAILVIATGCGTSHKVREAIDRAETLVEEHPDSAITILRTIERVAIKGQYDNARYALVYSEALYYSRIETTSDSLTGPMADYYILDEREHDERARALYQHSLVLQRQGHSAKALYMLLEAERSLTSLDNPRLSGLVQRTKGSIYYQNLAYYDAQIAYEAAGRYFEEANLEYHVAHNNYKLGQTLRRRRNNEAAYDHLTRALEYGLTDDNQRFVSMVGLELGIVCYGMSDFDSSRQALDYVTTDMLSPDETICYYCFMALLAARDGDFGTSEELLANANAIEPTEDNRYVSDMMTYTRCEYANICSMHAEATAYHAAMDIVQDRTMQDIIDGNTIKSEAQRLQNRFHIDRAQAKQLRSAIIIASIGLVAVLLIVVGLHTMRRRHAKLIASQIAKIRDLELRCQELLTMNTPNEKEESKHLLYVNEINGICNLYVKYRNSLLANTQIFDELRFIIESLSCNSERIAELEHSVNMIHNNVMAELRTHCPRLNEREYRIAIYSYAGFSNRAISALIGTSVDNVPKIKHRIREKMRSHNEQSDEIIESLMF